MASKNQKFNSYTTSFEEEVLVAYKSGKYGGRDQIAKKYNISSSTIFNWIRKVRNNEELYNSKTKYGSGRKKEKNIDYKERYEILKKYQAFLKAQRERK